MNSGMCGFQGCIFTGGFQVIPVVIPDLGEEIVKVQLIAWLVTEGQQLSEGEDIAEVVTDKAVFNIASPAAGVFVRKHYEPGAEIDIGATIAEIG